MTRLRWAGFVLIVSGAGCSTSGPGLDAGLVRLRDPVEIGTASASSVRSSVSTPGVPSPGSNLARELALPAESGSIVFPSHTLGLDLAPGAFVSPLAEVTTEDEEAGARPDLLHPAEDQWVLTFSPYAWLLGIDGDIRVGQTRAEVEQSFSDILENLSWVLEGRLDAYRNDWGFWFDGTLGKIEDESSIAGGVELDTTTDLKLVALAVSRVLYRGELGHGRPWMIEATAGVISTDIDTELRVKGPLSTAKFNLKEDWNDLTVGVRTTGELTPRVLTRLTALVGGFGIGDSSDFSAWVEPLFGYDIGDPGRWKTWAGYRLLWIDYERSRFEFDVLIHGPVLGASLTF